MAKKFRLSPLGDRVIVKPLTTSGEKKLASGIILPETVNKEKLFEGEVITVGSGRVNDKGTRIPLEVKPGDKVFFKKPWDEPSSTESSTMFFLSQKFF